MLLFTHLAAVTLSLLGFIVRGILMLSGSPLLWSKFTKVTPHIVDTVLLGSGIALIFATGFYPTEQPWLMGKILALVLYIILGTIALKRGKTIAIRLIAGILALAVFALMVLMAMSRQIPFG